MLVELPQGNRLYSTPVPKGKKVAVVDVDDVLYPCTEVLLNLCNTKFGASHTIEANTNFHIDQMYPEIGTKEKLVDFLINGCDYMCDSPFYTYAQSLMNYLHEIGYYVAVVTSRGFHPEGYFKTFKMFKDHNIHFDAMGTTRIGQSKLDFVLEHIHSDPAILLEDNIHVMKEFHEYGTKVIKFVQPWNVYDPNHTYKVSQTNAINDIAQIMKDLHGI